MHAMYNGQKTSAAVTELQALLAECMCVCVWGGDYIESLINALNAYGGEGN